VEGDGAMRSIDNLCEWWRDRFPVMDRQLGCDFREHIDEIEREVEDMVPLPVDADGVPIHVGDVMENIVCPPVHREVTGVGVECFYGWDEGNGRYSQFEAACYRHYHAPTVEDVLREFYVLAVRGKEAHAEDVDADVLTEYAAKLRLKEG